MHSDASADARQTYLVEHYCPGLSACELRSCALRVRETAVAMERLGRGVHHVRSMIMPVDQCFFCMFEAASEEVVRETYARAAISFERISTAIADESGEKPRDESTDPRGKPRAGSTGSMWSDEAARTALVRADRKTGCALGENTAAERDHDKEARP